MRSVFFKNCANTGSTLLAANQWSGRSSEIHNRRNGGSPGSESFSFPKTLFTHGRICFFFSFSIRKLIVRAPLGSSLALLSNQTLFLHFSVSWWEIDVKSAYKNQSNQTRAQTNKIFSFRVTAKRSLRRSWLRLMGNLTPMIFRLFEESIFLNNSRTCWDWL